MAAKAFDVDEHTAQVIASLRGAFGVKTDASVVRRALGLARMIAENADEDHSVLILRKNNTALKIHLAD